MPAIFLSTVKNAYDKNISIKQEQCWQIKEDRERGDGDQRKRQVILLFMLCEASRNWQEKEVCSVE